MRLPHYAPSVTAPLFSYLCLCWENKKGGKALSLGTIEGGDKGVARTVDT